MFEIVDIIVLIRRNEKCQLPFIESVPNVLWCYERFRTFNHSCFCIRDSEARIWITLGLGEVYLRFAGQKSGLTTLNYVTTLLNYVPSEISRTLVEHSHFSSHLHHVKVFSSYHMNLWAWKDSASKDKQKQLRSDLSTCSSTDLSYEWYLFGFKTCTKWTLFFFR